MTQLAQRSCTPVTESTPKLTPEACDTFVQELAKGWHVTDGHHLERTYTFKNFVEALAFTNALGEVAETQGHHPDIFLAWGKVKVSIWTHVVNGLTESDFILAAKIDTKY